MRANGGFGADGQAMNWSQRLAAKKGQAVQNLERPLDFVREILSAIEQDAGIDDRQKAFAALRPLGLGDFGAVLWSMPMEEFPRLSSMLPPMSADDVQKKWTGNAGQTVLEQGQAFVRSVSENYTASTGQTLRGRKILDFGCGYGRFLRLFRYYSDEAWGVDPGDEALEHCRAAGFGGEVRKSEMVPSKLPLDTDFDLGVAFSVFTHLSERCALACLSALRKSIRQGGVLCITIRPIEFWDIQERLRPGQAAKFRAMRSDHNRRGFAFQVGNTGSEDFGKTSITLEWIQRHAKGWEIVGSDRALSDAMQRYVFLRAI